MCEDRHGIDDEDMLGKCSKEDDTYNTLGKSFSVSSQLCSHGNDMGAEMVYGCGMVLGCKSQRGV